MRRTLIKHTLTVLAYYILATQLAYATIRSIIDTHRVYRPLSLFSKALYSAIPEEVIRYAYYANEE